MRLPVVRNIIQNKHLAINRTAIPVFLAVWHDGALILTSTINSLKNILFCEKKKTNIILSREPQ